MNTTSVAHARAQLAQAETAQAAERRAQLIDQLKTTRSELRSKTRELEKLKAKILKSQSALDNCREEIVRHSDALAMVQAQRPDVAAYLPDDPESVEWRKKCIALEDALEVWQARRATLPNVELLRIEGVALAQRVQQLMYAESNTLRELDPQERTGGVFGV